MLRIVCLLLLVSIISFPCYGKGGKKPPRILSVETAENSWSLNSELDYYHIDSASSQTTLYLQEAITYSTVSNWDLSISSQNIPVVGGGVQNFQVDTYFELQKTIKSNYVDLMFGGMYGYQLYPLLNNSSIGKSHQLYWVDIDKKLIDNPYYELKIHSGTFRVNSELSTKTAYFGVLNGFKLTSGKFRLQADYYGGHTNISGAVVTLNYFIRPWMQPYIGLTVPEKNSGNEFAGILGFNISTGNLY